MNLDFVKVAADGVVAVSPMARDLRAAGARFEIRQGWNVAVACRSGGPAGDVGWADVSHLPKLEIQGSRAASGHLKLGEAVRVGGAWWCRLTPTRALVIGSGPDVPGALDVTSTFAALTVVGPLARELLARFCALDLRPGVAPVGALRPGSVARQPGIVICEAENRYLLLFSWAIGQYMWSVVADAGAHLGGRPIGVDDLADLDA